MDKLTIKSTQDIETMAKVSRLLSDIRNQLAMMVKPGVTGNDVEALACKLIEKTGGKASFKMVPGYKHATCININDVVVHGIPDEKKFKEGDKVSIDVGLYLENFHSDTAVTVFAGKTTSEQERFLAIGKKALKKAIEQAKPGKKVADISKAIQKVIEEAGYSTVKALTGHGIGHKLHEQPPIPCFVPENWGASPTIREGMVIAIEVMYNEGTFDVNYKNDDGWTIATADGKISGLFEHTVAVTKHGPVVLTE